MFMLEGVEEAYRSQTGIKHSQSPSILCQRELLTVHRAHQHNLTLPSRPDLKLRGWETLSKGAPWAVAEVLGHFMCLKMKGTLKT